MTNKKVLLSSLTALACLGPAPVEGMGMPGGGGCVDALISITRLITPLSFASIIPCDATAGTLNLDEGTGTLTPSGCTFGLLGTPQRSRIRVRANQASNGDKVVISLPASVTIFSAGDTMAVTSLLLDTKGGRATVTIRGRQTVTLDIGATLNVAAGQPGGTYTGTATVSAVCR